MCICICVQSNRSQKRASDPLKLEWVTWSLVGLGTGLWSSLRAVIALNHWEPSLQPCLEKINLIDCETLSVSFLLLNVYRHCSSVGCLSREFWDRLTSFPYFYVYSFSWMPEIFLLLKPSHVVEAYLDDILMLVLTSASKIPSLFFHEKIFLIKSSWT